MTQPLSAEIRVAVFIDVDNLVICAQNGGLPFDLSLVTERVRQEGLLMSARAYADWTSNTLRPYISDFRSLAIELVELPTMVSAGQHKNTADIQLAVDALEMALSPFKPGTIVIVGGDRDYVPLVQKLKRYGIRVVGIGVQIGVSHILSHACDSFVFYDDLVPPAEEDALAATPPDAEIAFDLMRRAIEALTSAGRQPVGATVLQMMRQLDPTFDLARYKRTFKELATDARDAQFIEFQEQPGTDMLLSLGTQQREPVPGPSPREREYDFSGPSAASASYKTILQEERIPILPRNVRRELVAIIKEGMEQSDDKSLSLDEMRNLALREMSGRGIQTFYQAIQKFIYSLNFGHCFIPTGEDLPRQLYIPNEIHVQVRFFGSSKDIERALHKQYIVLLSRSHALLNPDGVYELLYDSSYPIDEEEQTQIPGLVTRWCDEVQPPTSFSLALREASRKAH